MAHPHLPAPAGEPQTEIVQRSPFLRVAFDDEGFAVAPLLSKGLRLDWSEIEFVCVTPAMVRDRQGWREKRYELLAPELRSTFARYGLLELSFVVRDRRPVLARAGGWWNLSWVGTALRPMLDERDRLQPDQSLLRVQVRKRQLDHPIDDLLDLLAKHCRFDLVVAF